MTRTTYLARALTSMLLSSLLLASAAAPAAAAAATTGPVPSAQPAVTAPFITDGRVTLTLFRAGLVGIATPGGTEVQYYDLPAGVYSWMIDPVSGAALSERLDLRPAGTRMAAPGDAWWWVYRPNWESPGQWLSVSHDGAAFRLTGKSDQFRLQVQVPTQFASLQVEEMVRQGLQKPSGPLTALDLAGLTQLRVSRMQIRNLAGIEQLTNLTHLSLSENPLVDLAPLAGLSNLKELHLRQTGISDLSPLSGLTQLERLFLDHNEITDLEPLRPLTGLTRLGIWDNEIADISPLAGMTKLTVLDMAENQILDLTPLAGMERLRWLWAADNPLEDLTPISGLSTLEELYLDRTGILDVEALAPLTNLTRLSLAENEIEDLEPLAGLTKLTDLDVTDNWVSDLTPLADLTGLRRLHIGLNLVEDLEPLAGLTQLEMLALSLEAGLNLSVLDKLPGLKDLTLDGRRDGANLLPGPLTYRLQTEHGIFLGDKGINLQTLASYAAVFERVAVPAFRYDFGLEPQGNRTVFRLYGDEATWLKEAGQTPFWGFNHLQSGQIFLSPWRQPDRILDVMMAYQYLFWLSRQEGVSPLPDWFISGLALNAVQRLAVGANGWPNSFTQENWEAVRQSAEPVPAITANRPTDAFTITAVAHLLETRGRAAFQEFFSLTRAGAPFGAAFQEAFGLTLPQFQAEYAQKVKSLRGEGFQ